MEEMVFKQLVFCYRDSMYRFACSLLHNDTEAQDIVQSVMLKLWQQRNLMTGLANKKGYVMKAVKNECLNKMQQLKNASRHLSLAGAGQPVSEHKNHGNITQLIHGFMDTLPQKQKMVMLLRDVEELDNQEIAELLDMEENAVRTNLARARQKVRDWLQKIEKYEQQKIQ